MQTVLRFQPIERRGVAAIGIHNSRGYTQENLPEHIDLSRSHLNKILVGPAVAEIPTAMKEAIKDIPVARKMKDPGKDLVMAECLLSASPEFFQQKGATEKWTRQSVKWLKSEFGDKLLSAVLHVDEQTPHIHAVIRVDEEKRRVHPVTKELMPAKKVLCYSDRFMDRKEVLTKARVEGRSHLDTKLGRFQTRYAESVSSLGLLRGRESARTQEKDLRHTTTQEWRDMQQLRKQVRQLKKEESQLQNKAAAITDQVTELAAKKISIEKSLAATGGDLAQVKSELTQAKGELAQVQKEKVALSAALAAEKKAFDKSVEKLQAEATEKIRPLLAEEQRLETSLVDLRSKYGVGIKKTEAQKVELHGLEKTLTDQNAKLEKIEAQIKSQSEALKSGQAAHDALLKNVSVGVTACNELQARLEKLQTPDSVWTHLVRCTDSKVATDYILKLSKEEVAKIGRQVGKEDSFVAGWQKHHEPEPVQQQPQQQIYTLDSLLAEGEAGYKNFKATYDAEQKKIRQQEIEEEQQERRSQSRGQSL